MSVALFAGLPCQLDESFNDNSRRWVLGKDCLISGGAAHRANGNFSVWQGLKYAPPAGADWIACATLYNAPVHRSAGAWCASIRMYRYYEYQNYQAKGRVAFTNGYWQLRLSVGEARSTMVVKSIAFAGAPPADGVLRLSKTGRIFKLEYAGKSVTGSTDGTIDKYALRPYVETLNGSGIAAGCSHFTLYYSK